MLASNWATLAHLEAMLGDVGAKMADKIGKMAIKSAKMSQDGETCWQCSAPARAWQCKAAGAGGSGGGSKT